MRSFVLLGSMLQSSSLVKADCTLQDGTVQIGARKYYFTLYFYPQFHPRLPPNQPKISSRHKNYPTFITKMAKKTDD